MSVKVVLLGGVVWLGAATLVLAQDAVELPAPQINEGAQAYQDATRLRRLQDDTTFFDPAGPAPSFETNSPLQLEVDVSDDFSLDEDWVETFLILSMVAAIIGVGFALLRSGGGLSVSFLSRPEAAARTKTRKSAAATDTSTQPAALAAILGMTDRRSALVALCKAGLARSVSQQGVLPQTSWTDRETLGFVPATHPHFEALSALVRDSERVQFGQRDVDQTTFDAHLARVRPLWLTDKP
jgi:hypothetical protein